MWKFFSLFSFIALGVLFAAHPVRAQEQVYYYENLDVQITLNKDSSFKVKETFKLNFTGEFHRVFREITLVNRENLEKCRADSTKQCGGFEFIKLNEVSGDGKVLKPSEYKISDVSVNSEDRMKIEWEFAPNGRQFNRSSFEWSVEYTVYGGLGYFQDYDLFYWNAIFPDRTVNIDKALVTINLPDAANITLLDVDVRGAYYGYQQVNEKTLTFSPANTLSPGENFTILVKLPKELVNNYASIKLNTEPKKVDITLDNDIFLHDKSSELKGITPGHHSVKISKNGYYEQTIELDLNTGEIKEVNIELKKTPLQQVIEIFIIVCNLAACPIFICIVGFVYYLFKKKGKDPVLNKAIVPWFNPPDDINPALLGGLINEKVNMKDISSTIINTAYKGYIKIIELEKKDYEFVILKSFDDLDIVEKRIMSDIMGANQSIKLSSLKNSFYTKVSAIKHLIYQTLVDKSYFAKRPDLVRLQYMGIAIGLIVFGFIATFTLPIIGIFLLGPALSLAGIISLPFAYAMPAKTLHGAEVLNQVKGFEMYLKTAERFRLQNLTPETFEKFLSYAMVLGIEKQWAEKFKDIYKTPPDWYQGRSLSTFDSLYLANALGSMQTNVSSTLSSSPSSSGGGWSGGGGFSGGFSGGGGGGGGGGAS